MKLLKKTIYILFIICLLFQTYSLATIETNNYFSITLPDVYTIRKDEVALSGAKYSYSISNSDNPINNIIIAIIDNTDKIKNNNLRTSDMDDFIEGLKEGYEEMGLSANTLQKEVTTFSKNKYVCVYLKFYIKAYGMYQKLYVTCSENYIYMICSTYVEDSEKELDSIVDSFSIRDLIYADTKDYNSSDTQLLSDRFWARIVVLFIVVLVSCAVYGIGKIKKANKK